MEAISGLLSCHIAWSKLNIRNHSFQLAHSFLSTYSLHIRFSIMSDLKNEAAAVTQPLDSELQQDGIVSEKKGTAGDQKDMYRMGKQQELRRNFRFVSIFGYSMVLMATWETILT
jgi:hypothetical protein